MKYNQLTLQTVKTRKRVGRGIAAGQGKTAGRGTKGQKSRAGSGARPGFEGGQNPLMQRLPKLRGFTPRRPQTETVYTGDLGQLKTTKIDNFNLFEAGLIGSPHSKVKLILKGAPAKKFQVSVQLASAGARAAIEKAGGTLSLVPQIGRQAKPKAAAKAR